MSNKNKPIYLLADSQLLFWREKTAFFLNRIVQNSKNKLLTAAYIGASNSDNPAYFSIFKAAIEQIGRVNCRMLMSNFSDKDIEFLENADVILLAGGDAEMGWKVFHSNNLKEIIYKRYFDGVTLIGVSAGAIQLGWGLYLDTSNTFLETFKLIPYVIGVHEENNDWHGTKRSLLSAGIDTFGFGIKSGGGLVYHSDGTIEPVRFPVHEFGVCDESCVEKLLAPPIESYVFH